MLEWFQTAGAGVSLITAIVGGVWGVWRFFLFPQLARTMQVSLDDCAFMHADRSMALVQITVKNASKTRTDIKDIYVRRCLHAQASSVERTVEFWGADWQWIGSGKFSPGEAQQLVFAIAVHRGEAAVMIETWIRYAEAADVAGIRAMLRRVFQHQARDENLYVQHLITPDSRKKEEHDGTVRGGQPASA